MGQQGLWYIGGTSRGGKMQGDDIIFPNLDMCLITLAGWFNKSLLIKNWNPRCNFLIFEPPWDWSACVSIDTEYLWGAATMPIKSCCLVLFVPCQIVEFNGWWLLLGVSRYVGTKKNTIYKSMLFKMIYIVLSWLNLVAKFHICINIDVRCILLWNVVVVVNDYSVII